MKQKRQSCGITCNTNCQLSKKRHGNTTGVGGTAINSSGFKGRFHRQDLEEIWHICTELEKLSKQYCLQTDNANISSAILKYKHQQKRTY